MCLGKPENLPSVKGGKVPYHFQTWRKSRWSYTVWWLWFSKEIKMSLIRLDLRVGSVLASFAPATNIRSTILRSYKRVLTILRFKKVLN